MLRDFELPSLKGITFDDLRSHLSQQAQNFLPRSNGE
jgi:[acyl-carrier-protein] S-malonyltransferase